VFSVKWTLQVETYAALTATQKQGMTAASGVEFNDLEHAILMGTNALPGYWIIIEKGSEVTIDVFSKS
jgi:hypothetical protein